MQLYQNNIVVLIEKYCIVFQFWNLNLGKLNLYKIKI